MKVGKLTSSVSLLLKGFFFFFESFRDNLLSGQSTSVWNFEGEKICAVLGFGYLKRVSRSNSPKDAKFRPKRHRDIEVGRMPNGIEGTSPSTEMKADALKAHERRVNRNLDKFWMSQSRDVHLAIGLQCSCGWASEAGGVCLTPCTLRSAPGARGCLLALPMRAEWDLQMEGWDYPREIPQNEGQ